MYLIIPFLYALSCILLLVAAVYVYRRNPDSLLHRYFSFGCFAVTLWSSTLFWYEQIASSGPLLLIVGRLNFASVLFISVLAYLFVRELTERPLPNERPLLFGTLIFAILTLVTPLIDRSELVAAGEHITRFGLLFPVYLVDVVGLLGAAIWIAIAALGGARRHVRAQISVIALGLFFTSAIGVTTNLILPYVFHIFALEGIGALSILLFIVASGYAITVEHLFDVRIVIRRTVVIAVMIAFVENAYSGLVSLLVHLIPTASTSPHLQTIISYVIVLFIAASFDPLRRWLSRQLTWILYRRRTARVQRPS